MEDMDKKIMESGDSRRNTRQKAMILDCLERKEGEHVTADEVVELLKQAGTPVGKATVYRYLGELEQGGRVRRYMGADNGPSCWQYVGEGSVCNEHYHLLCGTCGNIVHFESERLGQTFREVSERNGFAVDRTKIVFYGTCASCLAKGRKG